MGNWNIRGLRVDDLPEALTLSTSAGWNQRLEDWQMLRRLASESGFAAVSVGRVVGTALALDYGGFAWIAMMLVEPGYRGRGLGARLLEAALSSVPANRVIRLDATPAGRPLYMRHGFEDESTLARSVAPATRPDMASGPGAVTVRQLTPTDLARIASHDAGMFGGDRSAVLAWALEAAPQYARVVDGDGTPPQYAFGRPGRLFNQIGPVVATDAVAAAALVTAALTAATDRSVIIDAYDAGSSFVAWLRDCGFAGERPFFRMRRRPDQVSPSKESVSAQTPSPSPSEFAIMGPDFA
jgi:GNAT superfamily N-acetyltransferase